MLTPLSRAQVLVVEPNSQLVEPYCFLTDRVAEVTRLTSASAASQLLSNKNFDLVMASCSLSSRKLLHLLETIKTASQAAIIPLILVVDLQQPYSLVPGLSWAKQVQLLSSRSNAEMLELALAQLLI